MRALPSGAGQAWLGLTVALGMLAAGCSESEAPDDVVNPVQSSEITRIMPASEALAGAHIPTLDPATMNDAEIRKALGAGAHCTFRYTISGRPVLAVNAAPDNGAANGVVKLNGHLVPLRLEPADGRTLLVADEVRMTLTPGQSEQADEADDARREVNLVFEVNGDLKVGYRGYYECAG